MNDDAVSFEVPVFACEVDIGLLARLSLPGELSIFIDLGVPLALFVFFLSFELHPGNHEGTFGKSRGAAVVPMLKG